MSERFCRKHWSWLCAYGEGRCQKGDLWARSGCYSDEQPESAPREGSDGAEGVTGAWGEGA